MEKRMKFKILKRILPIVCALLCIATALITPIGAVVNSSQGEFNNYDITSRSTFPLTVGFSYASRDLSTGAGSSYVYSTYVGQYGVEYNQTENGSETYTYKYDAYGDGSTVVNQTGELLYTNYADEWKEAIEVENSGSYRFGKKRISMTNKNFSTGNIAGRQQGVVLRADDIVLNPYTVIDSVSVTVNTLGQEVYEYTYLDDISYAVPCFLTPNPLANTNNLGIEITYSWSCDVINANGEKSYHSGTATYDNRTADYQQEIVPIIDASTLANQIGGAGNGGKLSPTIIIQNYYGYLEYKYYEYQAPQIEFTLNGITFACPDGITWGEYANLDTTEYPSSSNADVRWLDSIDGTGMQYNNNGTWQFILYNGEVVDNTDTIIGRAVYTLEEISTIDELAGTWVLNSTLTIPTVSVSMDYTLEGSMNVFDSSNSIYSTDIGSFSLYTDYTYGCFNLQATNIAYNTYYYERTHGNISGCNDNDDSYSVSADSSDGLFLRSFTITSKLSEVTNGDTLLTWLKVNATKQGAVSLISFTINGTSYQAEQGMTWAQFVSSSYNTNGVKIDSSGNVLTSNGQRIATTLLSGSQISTDVIVANTSYVVQTAGGADDVGGGEDPSASNDFDWGAALDDGPSASAVSDSLTTTATGIWNEVDRTESAELVLWYPLLDTSGIIINDSEAYHRWYDNYSMPNMTKYVNTFGVEPPDMTFDFTSWIGTAVGGFLNMELMPNFSIGGVLAILIAFSIVMLFLKFFAGG